MIVSRTRVASVATAVTALTAVAAAAVVVPGQAAGAATATGRATVRIHTTAKHTVSVAARLRPGVVHLHDTGGAPVLVFRKKKEGPASLVRYVNASSKKQAHKGLTHFDYLGMVNAGTDSWLALARGTYYLLDGGAAAKVSRVRTVTVAGSRVNAVRPAGARWVSVDRHGRVTRWVATSHTTALRFADRYTDAIDFVVFKVAPGATTAQLDTLLDHPTETRLDAVVDTDDLQLEIPAFVGPSHDITTRAHLPAGRWLVIAEPMFGSGALSAGRLGVLDLH